MVLTQTISWKTIAPVWVGNILRWAKRIPSLVGNISLSSHMLLVYKSSQFFVGIPSNQMWQSKSSINEGSNRKIMELNGGFPVAVSAEGKPTCPFIVHSFFIHCSFIFHSLFIHFSLYHHCTTTILGEIPTQHPSWNHQWHLRRPPMPYSRLSPPCWPWRRTGTTGTGPKRRSTRWLRPQRGGFSGGKDGKSGISPAKMGMYCDCKPGKWRKVGMSMNDGYFTVTNRG